MMDFSFMMKMKLCCCGGLKPALCPSVVMAGEARPTSAKRRDCRVSRMIGFSFMMKMKQCCCGGLKPALRPLSGVIAGLRA